MSLSMKNVQGKTSTGDYSLCVEGGVAIEGSTPPPPPCFGLPPFALRGKKNALFVVCCAFWWCVDG